MEDIKDKISFEEIEAEQKQIEECYLTLRFAQQVRKEVIACYKKCGGTIKFPFRTEPNALVGKQELCFGDCLNVNFERGPFLHELGNIPEYSIAKKFIWPHSF